MRTSSRQLAPTLLAAMSSGSKLYTHMPTVTTGEADQAGFTLRLLTTIGQVRLGAYNLQSVLVLVLGGWFTGFWMRGGTDFSRLHPGYFLPTVAGGLVASAGLAEVGQPRFAQVMLGLGLVCWAIMGSMILGRLIFRPPLPDALAPTMAIEVAPAAVASLAHFFANGGHVDFFAAVLAGYGLLMVTAQLPLLPRYSRLSFSLGTWAFTFSWTAVAGAALFWIASTSFVGDRASSYLVLAAITGLVGGIAARTVLAARRGRLLPAAATASEPAFGGGSTDSS